MSHATSSTCHFNLSFINWARLSLLPRPPPYMSTYLLCVSIDMHSRVCKFLRVKCAKLDKSLYQEYTLTHAMREGERERSPNNWTCQLTCILVCASYCVSNVRNLTKTSVKNTHCWRRQWERERAGRDHSATELPLLALSTRQLASELRLRLATATAMAKILV